MTQGIASMDAIRIYDPGYADDGACIVLPPSILPSMGILEGQPIRIRVRDAPKEVAVLGPATSGDPDDPYTITGTPDPVRGPASPLQYSFRFPREWKEKHWRQPHEDMNDIDYDPYYMIDAVYDLEQSGRLLKDDGALIIPL